MLALPQPSALESQVTGPVPSPVGEAEPRPSAVGNWIGYSLLFGCGLGVSVGTALGLASEVNPYPPLVLICAMVGGTVGPVLGGVGGVILQLMERRERSGSDRMLRALLLGAALGGAVGLLHFPLAVITAPSGIACAWLTALWSAPLPAFPGERYLPLRRRWAWYFLSGALLAAAPLVALVLRWVGITGR